MNNIACTTSDKETGHQSYITGIDGLRAISVLSVVLYHLDSNILPGGFVGVDVFFVISGFVVAMTTRREHTRSFRQFLLVFYRRRIVRILPATLIFLLLAQLFVVLFVPTKDRITVPDLTAAAAALGMSNFVLWLKADDYFSPEANLNPFLHTWSLAIEEQFYLIFPTFAFLFNYYRASSRIFWWLATGLIGCIIASLTVAVLSTHVSRPFAFYMLPSRFWELATGIALFILVEKISGRPTAGRPFQILVFAAGLCGLIAIAAAYGFIDSVNFPFPYSIVPAISASLMLYNLYLDRNGLISRIFSIKILQYIGKISFSIYLWHWFVIVSLQWTIGLETYLPKFVALAASFLLADLSNRLIERPARVSGRIGAWCDGHVILSGLTAMGVVGASMGILAAARPSLTLSVTGDRDVWLPSTPGHGGRCQAQRGRRSFAGGTIRYDFVPQSCEQGADPRHLYVLGDSHAGAYQRLVGNIVRHEGLTATIFTGTGCAWLPMIGQTKTKCALFIENGLTAIALSAKSGDVIFFPGLRIRRYQTSDSSDNEAEIHSINYSDAMISHEAKRLTTLIDQGIRVVLEAPKPVYKYEPMRCFDWFNQANPRCREKSVPYTELQERRKQALVIYTKLKNLDPRIEIWDPFPLLCHDAACLAVKDGMPLVSDGDHLTGYANDYLTPFFANLLKDRQ